MFLLSKMIDDDFVVGPTIFPQSIVVAISVVARAPTFVFGNATSFCSWTKYSL